MLGLEDHRWYCELQNPCEQPKLGITAHDCIKIMINMSNPYHKTQAHTNLMGYIYRHYKFGTDLTSKWKRIVWTGQDKLQTYFTMKRWFLQLFIEQLRPEVISSWKFRLLSTSNWWRWFLDKLSPPQYKFIKAQIIFLAGYKQKIQFQTFKNTQTFVLNWVKFFFINLVKFSFQL